jgi:predicted PurR-regulated permease PerM
LTLFLFFGSGAVLIPWAIISFITSDIRMGIGMLIIYLSVILTRQMIEPKIVSSNIGINPLMTLMAMYIGYKIFSIGGMILGPVILMLGVSFYKAGAFDGIIRFIKKIFTYIKAEIQSLINYISMK